MEAKAYLQQLYRLDLMINNKKEELAEIESTLIGIRAVDVSADKVCSTKQSNDAGFTRIIERLEGLRTKVIVQRDIYLRKKHVIISQIHDLDNNKYADLLYKRYVEFKKFDVIAYEMGYSVQSTINMHGYALQCFNNKYHKMLV